MPQDLSASQEDYLEAILELAGSKGIVRVRDIAAHQDVSMPSVSGALKRLARQGLVRHERYDSVDLTREGRRLAGGVANRHALLKRLLTDVLRVDDKTADGDACAIEHHVSQKTIDALLRFFRSLDGLPDGSRRWLRIFHGDIASANKGCSIEE